MSVPADVRVYRAIEGLRGVRVAIGCTSWREEVDPLADRLQEALDKIIEALEGLHDDMTYVGRP